jgi:hypothetical protein
MSPRQMPFLELVPIHARAGTICALGEVIMVLAFRSVLWAIVLLAPGGVLLLPLLAIRQFKKSPRTDAASAPGQ